MRPFFPIALCASALAIAGCGSEEAPSAAPPQDETRAALEGAPAPLARLHAQANELLDGGPKAFEARLDDLRGHPVVVNKWGSWCPPCRAEFPYFQKQAVEHGKEVAFLGVDGEDSDAAAEKFLREYPVSFPSYKDPNLKVAAVMKAVGPYPSTTFFDSRGKVAHVKFGPYTDEEQLDADIERYAR